MSKLFKFPTPPGSEITSEDDFINRRQFVKLGAAATIASVGLPQMALASLGEKNLEFSVEEKPTSYKRITTYNNYYELGTDKADPARNAKWLEKSMKQRDPWSIEITGAVKRPGKIHMEDMLKLPLEERIYSFRCVERWSMVVPWNGFQLSHLIKKFEPTSEAKYVQFTTILDSKNLQGQRYPVLRWPYHEGLRMDEAMNPLTLMAVGIYGKSLLPQNGAPVRLVVPWKYGFKSIKSITKIHFTEEMPNTAWNDAAPNEYGFYANVNPNVHHPRWLQSRERRLGEFRKRDTLLFNGYGKQVASMYKKMDLLRYY